MPIEAILQQTTVWTAPAEGHLKISCFRLAWDTSWATFRSSRMRRIKVPWGTLQNKWTETMARKSKENIYHTRKEPNHSLILTNLSPKQIHYSAKYFKGIPIFQWRVWNTVKMVPEMLWHFEKHSPKYCTSSCLQNYLDVPKPKKHAHLCLVFLAIRKTSFLCPLPAGRT